MNVKTLSVITLLAGCSGATAPVAEQEAALVQGSSFTPFTLASEGCPMAHCTPQEDDANPLPAPSGISAVHQDHTSIGSAIGLGCSSNGSTAVCTMSAVPGTPAVVAYDALLDKLWDSGSRLDTQSFTSAALVDATGGAVAADDQHIIRFDSSGNVVWERTTPGGAPISPVPLPNGLVVLATKEQNGVAPISTYDLTSRAGTPGPSIQLTDSDETGDYIWGTVNTPGSMGNRIYVSMSRTPVSSDGGAKTDPKNKGALFALDVTETSIRPVWSFVFEGPSASSPDVTSNGIFFDGAGVVPDGTVQAPVFFGVKDTTVNGVASPHLMWTYTFPDGAPNCNAAHDPRGGVWTFGTARGAHDVVRLSESEPACRGPQGSCPPAVLQTLDFTQLLGSGASPGPTMTFAATGSSTPQLLMPAHLADGTTPLVDLDVVDDLVVWQKVAIDENGNPQSSVGQFPALATSTGLPAIVFTTIAGGTYSFVQ